MHDPSDLAGPAENLDQSPALTSPSEPKTYLETLNEAQRQAAETTNGPVLVLAGAGTGKTRVLTTRLAHILMQGKAQPWQMLAVTFTNKAAREMKERVSRLVGVPVEGWWVGTFHSISAKLLRKHAGAVGLKSNFSIIDKNDQERLIKNICKSENIDTKKISPKYILAVIDTWKNNEISGKLFGNGIKSFREDCWKLEKLPDIYLGEALQIF